MEVPWKHRLQWVNLIGSNSMPDANPRSHCLLDRSHNEVVVKQRTCHWINRNGNSVRIQGSCMTPQLSTANYGRDTGHNCEHKEKTSAWSSLLSCWYCISSLLWVHSSPHTVHIYLIKVNYENPVRMNQDERYTTAHYSVCPFKYPTRGRENQSRQ